MVLARDCLQIRTLQAAVFNIFIVPRHVIQETAALAILSTTEANTRDASIQKAKHTAAGIR